MKFDSLASTLSFQFVIVSVTLLTALDAQFTLIPPPPNAGSTFGNSVLDFEDGFLGDLDGDGSDDFIVCETDGTSLHLWITSGATFAPLLDFSIGTAFIFATADVDGDGTREIVTDAGVWNPLTGNVSVVDYSGLVAGYFWSGNVRDVDGDGRDNMGFVALRTDPVLGTLSFGLHVFDHTGALLYTVTFPPGHSHFRVAPMGDVDGDGCEDLVVGSIAPPDPFGAWVFDPGHAAIVSGQSGATLASFTGGLGSLFGNSVTAIGDADGDGVPDVLVTSPAGPGFGMQNSHGTQGHIWMISGATLQISLVHECIIFDRCRELSSLGDVDGDGFGDFVSFAGFAQTIFSGRTFSFIPFSYFLTPASLIGDIDGDGVGEALTPFGLISLLRGSHDIFGHPQNALATPNTPKIGISGRAEPGGSVTVNASNVPDDVPAFLMIGGSNQNWGTRSLPFDVSMSGIGGCDILISPDLIVPTFTTSIGIKSFATLTFPLPNDPSIVGLTRYVQWYVTTGGSGPGALSAAASITFEAAP